MIDQVAYVAMHTSPLALPGTGNAGGMNVYLDELARTMAGRGIEVTIFTRSVDEDTPELVEVVPGYRLATLRAGPPAEIPTDCLAPFVGEFADELVKWASIHGADFDVVHSHYWLSGQVGVIVKKELGIPLANSFHTLGRVKDAARHPDEASSSPVRLLAEEDVIAASDCVIASTPYEFDDLLTHYRARPERLCVSPPGIDHDVFFPGDRGEARRRLGIDGAPIVLFVGRLQRHKGPDVAVDAHALLVERVADAELVLVGGPSGRDGDATLELLEERIAAHGTGEQVRFVPAQPHPAIADWFRAADVLIMPSRSESFGLVAAEAQACGLPVVASRVGGIPHIVKDAESGILVDDHRPDDLAAALEAVITSPSFRADLSAGAVRFARRFSWSATADRLLELYAGIVG